MFLSITVFLLCGLSPVVPHSSVRLWRGLSVRVFECSWTVSNAPVPVCPCLCHGAPQWSDHLLRHVSDVKTHVSAARPGQAVSRPGRLQGRLPPSLHAAPFTPKAGRGRPRSGSRASIDNHRTCAVMQSRGVSDNVTPAHIITMEQADKTLYQHAMSLV